MRNGEGHPAGLQADEHDVLETVVALDDLVGDAGQRPLDVLSGEDLDPRNEDPTSRWGQSAFSLCQGSSTVRSGLSGPASRSSCRW